MFGEMPAYGFFIRHVRGLQMSDITLKLLKEDARVPYMISDGKSIDLNHLQADRATGVSNFVLNEVEDFSLRQSYPLQDVRSPKVTTSKF